MRTTRTPNIITVHRGDEKKKDIVALVDVLHSKEIQDWIRTKYKGAVIPLITDALIKQIKPGERLAGLFLYPADESFKLAV
ncbi:methionine ABC transporter substrate-binding protein [Enterobacter cancerogenus]|uniref:Methionine ABC transporter substrate-binding protein n=1 Tax=Enterobacter cancerogenus TaxID=69218 RepID=A0A484Z599_9ENTR|nr:methionine ABC transporter substrate-binding protein [Enterobacter cancerogenus]